MLEKDKSHSAEKLCLRMSSCWTLMEQCGDKTCSTAVAHSASIFFTTISASPLSDLGQEEATVQHLHSHFQSTTQVQWAHLPKPDDMATIKCVMNIQLRPWTPERNALVNSMKADNTVLNPASFFQEHNLFAIFSPGADL